MSYQFLLYERRNHTGVVTINRPEVLNALHEPAWAELLNVFSEADRDPEVRTIVITGAGDRAFSTGWDLNEASELTAKVAAGEVDPRTTSSSSRRFYRGFPTWKPVIAAVNGFCVAGGLELALMCDIIVAAEHAQFGLQEVRWAIIPGGGGTQRLPRYIAKNIAVEAILTGDRFDAQTAHRAGLANHVVPKEQVMEKALAIAATIAKRGPLAVRNAKQAIYRGLDMPLQQGLDLEEELSDDLLETEDASEGPRAFIEKRAPVYRGR